MVPEWMGSSGHTEWERFSEPLWCCPSGNPLEKHGGAWGHLPLREIPYPALLPRGTSVQPWEGQ